MTDKDRELLEKALETLEWHLEKGAWGADIEGVTAALRDRLEQPQRTHWEGCEEVHPECKKPEQEESEAVRAAWMAGYTEGEREAIENQPVQQQEPVQDDLIPPDSLFVCGQMGANVTRVRLAEPVQKPVASVGSLNEFAAMELVRRGFALTDPLYTAPPRREWVGLTEEEIKILWIQYRAALPRYLCFALAIEAALRKKNT